MPNRHKKHRELWPMPVQEIIENPTALTMPSAVFGALMRLSLHYWITNCSPLPESSAELQVISRAVAPIWNKHRATIMQVFREIQPSLDRYWRKRKENKVHLDFAARKGGAGRQRLAQVRSAILPPVPTAAGSIPRTLPKTPAAETKAQTSKKGLRKDRIPLAA